MSLGLALAAIIAAPANVTDEATCISDALWEQSKAGKPFDPSGPTEACRSRFGWTPEETELAVAVAKALGISLDDRNKAVAAGASAGLLDEVFASFSDADIAKLGHLGQRKDQQQVMAANNVRAEVANRLAKRDPEGATRIEYQLAVISRGILRNTSRTFAALRAKRD